MGEEVLEGSRPSVKQMREAGVSEAARRGIAGNWKNIVKYWKLKMAIEQKRTELGNLEKMQIADPWYWTGKGGHSVFVDFYKQDPTGLSAVKKYVWNAELYRNAYENQTGKKPPPKKP